MSRNTEELQGISLLGNQKTQYPTGYAPEILEAFDNKHPRQRLFRQVRLSRIHQPLPHDRAARLCHHLHPLYPRISKWWKASP